MINVALVGFGYAGRTFHAPLIESTPGLHLHTSVSSNPEAPGRRVATLEEALTDPQVQLVVLATPNPLHAPQARQALAAGKFVVVDKPLAITHAEALELCHPRLSVFHNRRWDGDFLTLQQLLPALGEVTQFTSHFDRFRLEVRDRWRERDEPGSGTWFDLGSHLVDQALQLFGRPQAIFADLAHQRGGPADDYFHALLRYPKTRVLLHASTLTMAPGPRFSVHGTAGSLATFGLDVQEAQLLQGLTPNHPDWGLSGQPADFTDESGTRTVSQQRGSYGDYYAAVRDAISSGAALPVRAEEAAEVLEVLEAGARSSRQRSEVPLG